MTPISFCRVSLKLSNKACNTKRQRIYLDSNTKAMSIKMINDKELESNYGQMVLRKEESGIRISCMAQARLHMIKASFIWGNGRIIKRKDMGQ